MRTSLVGLLAIVYLSGLSNALKCHQCNQETHTKCGDPFFYEGEVDGDGKPVPRTTEFLLDCPSDGKNYTLCRKMYQNVRGEERVIRGCGYIEKKRGDEVVSCYSTVLEEYNTFVCTCKDGDGCNGSAAHAPFTAAIMATAALILAAATKCIY